MKETSLWQIFFIFFISLLIKYVHIDSNFLKWFLVVTFFANFIIFFVNFVSSRFVLRLVNKRTNSNVFSTYSEEGDTELNVRTNTNNLSVEKEIVEMHQLANENCDRNASDARSSSLTISPLYRNDSESSLS